jgi:CheY-like chemotaxis protein
MDGRTLLGVIRERDKEQKQKLLPAVALSAFAREEDVRLALDAGFQKYLRKPVDPDELLRTLARCL